MKSGSSSSSSSPPPPSNVVRFPLELVRPDTAVLWEIEPDYREIDGIMIHREDENGESMVVPDFLREAAIETEQVISTLDRRDPTAYRAALKQMVAAAVAKAIPACRAWQPIRREYHERWRLMTMNKRNGFFERLLEDFRPVYEHHAEVAYEAAQRAHGIDQAVNAALEGRTWQPIDLNDLSWMFAPPRVAGRT